MGNVTRVRRWGLAAVLGIGLTALIAIRGGPEIVEYGPRLDSVSGSLYDDRTELDPERSYALSASASGHAMEPVRVLLNGQQMTAYSPRPCAERCSRSTTWDVAARRIPPGPNTVTVVARSGSGETAVEEFEVFVAGECDVYVAPAGAGGSDSNPGTLEAPYLTVAQLFSSVQAGETACFRAGTYEFGTENLEAPDVTLRPYLSEEVTLMGSLRVHHTAEGAVIQGFTLDGRTSDPLLTDDGPKLYAHDVVLRDNEVTNAHTGICIQINQFETASETGPIPRNVRIEGNRVHDCGRLPRTNHDHGIYVGTADDAIVRNNWFYDNADRGIQLYPDADDTLVTGNVIEGNGEGLNFSCDEEMCSEGNTATGNVISGSEDRWNVYGHSQGAVPDGSNALVENCVHASNPQTDGEFNTNGGIESNPDFFVERGNLIAPPDYADPAAGDLHLPRLGPCAAKYTGVLSLP